jgi:TolB-like protein
MRRFLLLFFMSALFLSGSVEVEAETKPTLAILPFLVERAGDPSRGAICPVCQGVYKSGNILSGSQRTLTTLLQQKMEVLGTFKVLPLERVEDLFSKADKGQFELTPLRSAIRLGKELDADFIFVGSVFRFEERVGSRIGVDKPASVAFDVHLLRVKDGKRVWNGKFDETQQALSENLLKIGSFVRRGAAWLKAEELSSVGMDEMLKRFPSLKELEEMP